MLHMVFAINNIQENLRKINSVQQTVHTSLDTIYKKRFVTRNVITSNLQMLLFDFVFCIYVTFDYLSSQKQN